MDIKIYIRTQHIGCTSFVFGRNFISLFLNPGMLTPEWNRGRQWWIPLFVIRCYSTVQHLTASGCGGKGVPSIPGENLQIAPVAPPPHPIPFLAVLKIGVSLKYTMADEAKPIIISYLSTNMGQWFIFKSAFCEILYCCMYQLTCVT